MGTMDVGNGGGNESNWNYSDKAKPEYMPYREGTIIEIRNPQSKDFYTGAPKFFQDSGVPMRNVMYIMIDNQGFEFSWTFSPKSLSADAVKDAFNLIEGRSKFTDIIGKRIGIGTTDDKNHWKSNGKGGFARPWQVSNLGDGNIPVRGIFLEDDDAYRQQSRQFGSQQPGQGFGQPQQQWQGQPQKQGWQGAQAQQFANPQFNAQQQAAPMQQPSQGFGQPQQQWQQSNQGYQQQSQVVQPQQFNQQDGWQQGNDLYDKDIPF